MVHLYGVGTTLLLSVAAVAIAHLETARGLSKDPLEDDPRHRRHRRRQRRRSQIQAAAAYEPRPREYETVAEVAAVVREATDPDASVAPGDDHETVARAIGPHSHRLRSACRSASLSAAERRSCQQFRRLIHQYADGRGAYADRSLEEIHAELHQTATAIHDRYRSSGTEATDPTTGRRRPSTPA